MLVAMIAFLIDFYLGAILIEWLLAATQLRSSVRFTRRLRRLVYPYLALVRHHIGLAYAGHVLTRQTAVVLLLVTRLLLQGVAT